MGSGTDPELIGRSARFEPAQVRVRERQQRVVVSCTAKTDAERAQILPLPDRTVQRRDLEVRRGQQAWRLAEHPRHAPPGTRYRVELGDEGGAGVGAEVAQQRPAAR